MRSKIILTTQDDRWCSSSLAIELRADFLPIRLTAMLFASAGPSCLRVTFLLSRRILHSELFLLLDIARASLSLLSVDFVIRLTVALLASTNQSSLMRKVRLGGRSRGKEKWSAKFDQPHVKYIPWQDKTKDNNLHPRIMRFEWDLCCFEGSLVRWSKAQYFYARIKWVGERVMVSVCKFPINRPSESELLCPSSISSRSAW